MKFTRGHGEAVPTLRSEIQNGFLRELRVGSRPRPKNTDKTRPQRKTTIIINRPNIYVSPQGKTFPC